MKYILSIFLFLHGMIHSSYLTPKPDDPKYPFDFTKGWFATLVGSSAQYIGVVLAIITVAAFLLAALGAVGVGGLSDITKITVTIGSISSLLLLVLFWHSWLILGIVIDVILLYGIYRYGWTFNLG